ncbi:MAG: hypothetical protein PUD39_00170 [Bacteroidales bacterium]|nr:hypothetical protein [Bacteroidales bacterium]
MRSRITRLSVIVDILSHNNISCQEELLKQLAIRGYIVTQATLSRDLKKLRTTKVANDLGGYRYVVPTDTTAIDTSYEREHTTMQSAQHPAALSVSVSGNILVIKTRNGYASGLAYDLDMLDSPIILGTIPGADTVLAVIAEGTTRADLYALLSGFLPTEVMNASAKYFED